MVIIPPMSPQEERDAKIAADRVRISAVREQLAISHREQLKSHAAPSVKISLLAPAYRGSPRADIVNIINIIDMYKQPVEDIMNDLKEIKDIANKAINHRSCNYEELQREISNIFKRIEYRHEIFNQLLQHIKLNLVYANIPVDIHIPDIVLNASLEVISPDDYAKDINIRADDNIKIINEVITSLGTIIQHLIAYSEICTLPIADAITKERRIIHGKASAKEAAEHTRVQLLTRPWEVSNYNIPKQLVIRLIDEQ